MALCPMREILEKAEREGYGVGAFNVNNMEQLQGVIRAGEETESPVILQLSRITLEYTDKEYLTAMIKAAAKKYPHLPIAMHLDHGESFALVKEAIALGFTSVMIDGSLKEDGRTPRDFDDNVRLTSEVAEYAHKRGVTVEGEIGIIGGVEDGIQGNKAMLANPEDAERFAGETGVDALALAIGTSHGVYKFKAEPELDLDIVTETHRRIPDTFLVMHGASSVPQELVEEINKYGGSIEKSMGVPVEIIKEAVRSGIRKINIDTDSRLAFTGAVRRYLHEHPEVFDHRKYLGKSREIICKLAKSKMVDFGSSGKA